MDSQTTTQVLRMSALLFVDISGSTALYESLGDQEAHARIDQRLRLLDRAAAEHGGQVVKSMGDGLMCDFANADGAVHAAHAMQLTMFASQSGLALGIHVGCHFGPVLDNEGDVYGDSVNVAAHIVGIAKTGQVIVTREMVDRLSPHMRDKVRPLGEVTVKGRREPVQILEYVWERSPELTTIRRIDTIPRISRLRLLCGGNECTLDASHPDAITLGRDGASAIVIGDREASRQHARIERRADRFVLIDHSSNGTYVVVENESEVWVRREEFVLRGRGRIALGRPTGDPNATVVEYFSE
jgi:class 3 adenylate cyclase